MSVEKKEDAIMDCGTCGLRLVCHEKTYPASANYKAKTVMQWQNSDGSPHFKWISEGKYKCVDKDGNDIPGKDEVKVEPEMKPKEGQSTKIVEEIKKDEPLDTLTLGMITREATLLFKIKQAINETITKISTTEPHQGMIWQMTELIYKKRLEADLP